MNKRELIKKVSRETRFSEKETGIVLNVILENIAQELAEGERVNIVGFGAFEPRVRTPRMGIDPRSKEKIQIGQSVVPAFRAGKSLKDSVNHR